MYYRYVDGTFAACNDEDECNEFFSRLNSLHPSLRFVNTFEKECNRTLPFVDVLVEKNDHEFVTSIYRKPTFTGQYIRCFCPMKRKFNLISTLVHRALVICSKSTLHNELSNIRTILINNGYPEAVINTVNNQENQSVSQTNAIRSEEMPCLSSLAMAGQCFDEVQNAN